mgnify:CR=1 FL=1
MPFLMPVEDVFTISGRGGVTAAFILAQDVHLAHKLGVGLDGAGLAQNLTGRPHRWLRRCH